MNFLLFLLRPNFLDLGQMEAKDCEGFMDGLKKGALQQNLWGPPGGSGRDPSVWYSAI